MHLPRAVPKESPARGAGVLRSCFVHQDGVSTILLRRLYHAPHCQRSAKSRLRRLGLIGGRARTKERGGPSEYTRPAGCSAASPPSAFATVARRGAPRPPGMSQHLKRSPPPNRRGKGALRILAAVDRYVDRAWVTIGQTARQQDGVGLSQVKISPAQRGPPKGLSRPQAAINEQILPSPQAARVSGQRRQSASGAGPVASAQWPAHFPQNSPPQATCCQTAMQRSEHIALCRRPRENTSRPGPSPGPDTSRRVNALTKGSPSPTA